MPRFFLHLHDDVDAPDPEGKELPDLEAAIAEATKDARLLMCDTLKEGRIVLHHRIDIENGGGEVLATLQFRDAVTIEG